jgi:hypothetical protein
MLIGIADGIAQVEIVSQQEAEVREKLLSLAPAARADLAATLDELKEALATRQAQLQDALDKLLSDINALGGGS